MMNSREPANAINYELSQIYVIMEYIYIVLPTYIYMHNDLAIILPTYIYMHNDLAINS
jgi:hypothetical protein